MSYSFILKDFFYGKMKEMICSPLKSSGLIDIHSFVTCKPHRLCKGNRNDYMGDNDEQLRQEDTIE